MAKTKVKPNRITLFLAKNDPNNARYVQMAEQTGIPRGIVPAEDGPIIWLRYKDRKNGSQMLYGPTAVKYCLERLAR